MFIFLIGLILVFVFISQKLFISYFGETTRTISGFLKENKHSEQFVKFN